MVADIAISGSDVILRWQVCGRVGRVIGREQLAQGPPLLPAKVASGEFWPALLRWYKSLKRAQDILGIGVSTAQLQCSHHTVAVKGPVAYLTKHTGVCSVTN